MFGLSHSHPLCSCIHSEIGIGSRGGALGAGPSYGDAPMASSVLEMKQRRLEDEHEAVLHEYSLLLTGQLEVRNSVDLEYPDLFNW